MKKILYILPLLTALVSCQKEALFSTENDVVTINATIGGGIPLSRANTSEPAATSWTSGDKIAVNNEGDGYITYTYSGTSWDAASGEFLKWSSPTMAFNGYYPVTEGTSLNDFVLPTDQTDKAKISSADYMTVSENKTKPASGYNVDLNFTRKTARVIVKITKIQNEFVGTPVISNLKITSAYAHYSSGITVGDRTAVAAYKAAEDSYIALVIPYNGALNGDFITLDVTDDLGTKSLKLSTIYATDPGKSYTHNLTVGKGKIELGSVTVVDWTGREVIPEGDAVVSKCDEWDGTYATSLTGIGTKDSPYLIQTAEELALMSTSYYNEIAPINRVHSYYKLTTDIDLKYRDWTPIGSGLSDKGTVTSQSTFSGAFDGNGHTIMGLKVTATDILAYVGLFGHIGPNYDDLTFPTIQNLIIKNAEIYAGTKNADEFQGAGILAGFASRRTVGPDGSTAVHTAKIKNCHVTGTILQADGATKILYVGGLCGYAQGAEIENCSANVTIDTEMANNVGGLFGAIYVSSINNCRSKGSVTGTWSMGGFVGLAEAVKNDVTPMTITNCTASVDVTSSNWNVGGFIGFMNATITNCSASGNVTSTPKWNTLMYKTGGFVGTNSGVIKKCTYSGKLTYADLWKYYGGFTGYHEGGFTENCCFDGNKNPMLDTSGLSWINEDPLRGSNNISNKLE